MAGGATPDRSHTAAALGILKAGHEVVLYERYREARPAGNILNLWPPPVKALRALGVDIADLGAPTDSEFRSIRGKVRVRVKLDPEVKRAYGGGFIGLLRPELYARMLAALPPGCIRSGQQVEKIEQNEGVVLLHFADGTTAEHDVLVGADGIDSLVRRTLWGAAPKREHRVPVVGAQRGRPGRSPAARPQGGRRRARRRLPRPAARAGRRDRAGERAALGAARPAGA
jgi:2-polyprenyl-6-methoxyphenol hydroxylase-like FAD-dependent oxidoreductase